MPGEDNQQNVKDILDKQKLNKVYPGTKFCTRFGATYNPKYNDGDSKEDECCKILKGCEMQIPYMHYRHGYLNVNMYDIAHCDCLEGFKKCLEETQTDFSRELTRLFFGHVNHV